MARKKRANWPGATMVSIVAMCLPTMVAGSIVVFFWKVATSRDSQVAAAYVYAKSLMAEQPHSFGFDTSDGATWLPDTPR
jgi:hypothetical protein